MIGLTLVMTQKCLYLFLDLAEDCQPCPVAARVTCTTICLPRLVAVSNACFAEMELPGQINGQASMAFLHPPCCRQPVCICATITVWSVMFWADAEGRIAGNWRQWQKPPST
jgi:hypothetical protein